MRTTLKHIGIGSAFRVGFVLYGLAFLIFGLLLVAFQGLLLSGLANFARGYAYPYGGGSFDTRSLLGAGVLGLLCGYLIGVVMAAVFGGISFGIGAFFYNVAAGLVGGLSLELQSSDSGLLDDIERDMAKRKRDET